MKMSIGEFIKLFREYSGLKTSVEEINRLALNKAVELVFQNTNKEDDKYGAALKECTNLEQVARLVSRDYGAYTVYMSGLIIILDELTRDMIWNAEQKQLINGLLDSLEVFHEV